MIKYVVLFAVVLASVLRARMADVTGEWSVVARLAAAVGKDADAQQVELVCTFAQDDTNVVGSCRPASGPEGIPISGAAHGKNVEWSFQIAPNEKEKKERATFRGTVGTDGSVMNGTLEFGASRGDFRAKKRRCDGRRTHGLTPDCCQKAVVHQRDDSRTDAPNGTEATERAIVGVLR